MARFQHFRPDKNPKRVELKMKLAFGSFLQVARLAYGDDSTDYEGDVLCDVKTGSKINCSPGDVGLTVPLCAFPPEAITDPYMVNEACVGNVVGDNLGRFSKKYLDLSLASSRDSAT